MNPIQIAQFLTYFLMLILAAFLIVAFSGLLGVRSPLNWTKRQRTFPGLVAAFRLGASGAMGGLLGDSGILKAGGNASGSLAGAAASRWQRGGVFARTGAGVYTITLDEAMVNTEDMIIIQAEGGAGNTNAQVAHTSATVKTVTIFVAAVATDVDFSWLVVKGAHGLA